MFRPGLLRDGACVICRGDEDVGFEDCELALQPPAWRRPGDRWIRVTGHAWERIPRRELDEFAARWAEGPQLRRRWRGSVDSPALTSDGGRPRSWRSERGDQVGFVARFVADRAAKPTQVLVGVRGFEPPTPASRRLGASKFSFDISVISFN